MRIPHNLALVAAGAAVYQNVIGREHINRDGFHKRFVRDLPSGGPDVSSSLLGPSQTADDAATSIYPTDSLPILSSSSSQSSSASGSAITSRFPLSSGITGGTGAASSSSSSGAYDPSYTQNASSAASSISTQDPQDEATNIVYCWLPQATQYCDVGGDAPSSSSVAQVRIPKATSPPTSADQRSTVWLSPFTQKMVTRKIPRVTVTNTQPTTIVSTLTPEKVTVTDTKVVTDTKTLDPVTFTISPQPETFTHEVTFTDYPTQPAGRRQRRN